MPTSSPDPTDGLHHVELWTHNLERTGASFGWLLETLGWRVERIEGWAGRIWRRDRGPYLVLEQSADVRGTRHERTAPGLNHLALTCQDREMLDRLRAEASAHGWREMFRETYPHAGGADHTAWYAENDEGFEVEVVAG